MNIWVDAEAEGIIQSVWQPENGTEQKNKKKEKKKEEL